MKKEEEVLVIRTLTVISASAKQDATQTVPSSRFSSCRNTYRAAKAGSYSRTETCVGRDSNHLQLHVHFVWSSASADVGVLVRSKACLSLCMRAEQTTGGPSSPSRHSFLV
jgi:hypothetical protein